MLRESRKLQHIQQALKLQSEEIACSLLSEIKLIHNCLPELDLADVVLATRFLNKKIAYPVVINALTGGSQDVVEYNRKLAIIAEQLQIPIAVGSQFSAIENTAMRKSFAIVRELNPNGIVIANIGAHANLKQAEEVVAMINADALQVHLNPAQELIMQEGDRSFRGYLRNIETIVGSLKVPVIVKETGCGIYAEQLSQLLTIGVEYFDVGGCGGTNFLAIEAGRRNVQLEKELLTWGIPTAVSLAQASTMLASRQVLIATGGIKTSMDIVRCLAMGADLTGMAMYFLNSIVQNKGIEDVLTEFRQLMEEVRTIMLLTGAKTSLELRCKQLHISGDLRAWLQTTNIDLAKFKQQRRCGQ